MNKFKVGDRIQYEYDNKHIVTGVIYSQGLEEDDEDHIFNWFSEDNTDDTFSIEDKDDVWRITSLNENIFG